MEGIYGVGPSLSEYKLSSYELRKTHLLPPPRLVYAHIFWSVQ